MNREKDIRWIQRLHNYEKALNDLKAEVESAKHRLFSKLEKKGLIQSFEIVQELSWKVLRDFLMEKGYKEIFGSRDTFQLAFKEGIITQGQTLMDSIKSRNLSVHTYNEEIVESIFNDIINNYYLAFEEIRQFLLEQKLK